MVGVKHRVRRAPTGEFLAFQYNGASIKSESGMPRLPNRDAKASAVAQPKLLDAAMKIAKGIFRMSDEGESKLRPLPPCLLPVHNPSLEPEHYKGPGWGLGWIRVPCAPCGVQYDIRESRALWAP